HKSFFSPAVSRVMLDDYVRQLAERGITDRYDTLSEREREVFQLIAEGRVNKEGAELLHVSLSTVETHRARIMEQLDVHSPVEIRLDAVRKGTISCPTQREGSEPDPPPLSPPPPSSIRTAVDRSRREVGSS